MVVAHVKRSMIDKWSQPWFLGFTWTLKSQTQSLKLLKSDQFVNKRSNGILHTRIPEKEYFIFSKSTH